MDAFLAKSGLFFTPISGSLLDLPLPESVKMEVCRLFHHLCDLQLRHRIESIVNFANTAVGEIQNVSACLIYSVFKLF